MTAFGQLRPGQLAQIPGMHTHLGEAAPPIVRIEDEPTPCGDCPDLRVAARDIGTGTSAIYHRPSTFEVALIYPRPVAAATSEES